jgi:hypothetical protein
MDILDRTIKQVKEIKCIQIEKGRNKLLFIGNMISYIENPKEFAL